MFCFQFQLDNHRFLAPPVVKLMNTRHFLTMLAEIRTDF